VTHAFSKSPFQVVLAIALLLVGFLIAWQLRTENNIRSNLHISSQRLEEMGFTLRKQARHREALESEIVALRDQLRAYEQSATRDRGALAAINRQLEEYRALAGHTALAGPGIVVELRDSIRPSKAGDDPNLTILHYSDIYGIVAALWAAGAEAIAINGERVVSNTGLSCVGTTILCNAKRIAPPYVIAVIGDPQRLAEAMAQEGGPLNLLRAFDFPVKVTRVPRLRLPAYRGAFPFSYGRPAGERK